MTCETPCKGALLHPSRTKPCYIHRISRFEFKRMEQTFCVESLAVIARGSVTIQQHHPQGFLALSIQHLCSLKARKDDRLEYASFCKRIPRSSFLHIFNVVALPIQSMHVLSSNPPQILHRKEIDRHRKGIE